MKEGFVMLKNVETKVVGAAAGAGGGGALSGFLLWILGVLVWHQPADAEHAQAAINAVPFPVVFGLMVVLSVFGALIGGNRAPTSPVSGGVSAPPLDAVLRAAGLFDAPSPSLLAASVPVPVVGEVPLSPGDVTSRAVPGTDSVAPATVPEVPAVSPSVVPVEPPPA